MIARKVSPPLKEMERLRQPLTPGERMVLDLFLRELPLEWEIYVQPHLNGLRPDFVLLNPAVGIAVFEVKDWDLDALHYFVAVGRHGGPVLMARDGNGVEFSKERENPVRAVNRYKQSIHEIYCPRIKGAGSFGVVTAGVIFPFSDTGRVKALLAPFMTDVLDTKAVPYHPVSGVRDVADSIIQSVFPEVRRQRSKFMTPELASDLRGWLEEPDFAGSQREPLKLDAEQRRLVNDWPASGYRRLKGPAGSGKSVVLAARTAYRASLEKSVLVVTYNITLWHYLRDLVAKGLDKPNASDLIRFRHFHSFCKDVIEDAGYGHIYDSMAKAMANDPAKIDHTLNVAIPELACRALNSPDVQMYDTIVLDEGQDYRPEWWSIVRKALKPGGEALLVADNTQDIYGTSKAWTEQAMNDMGFGGRWARLGKSYRLPAAVQEFVGIYAKTFIDPERMDLPEPEQADMALDNCTLRWIRCCPEEAVEAVEQEILTLMTLTGGNGTSNADITLLTDDTAVGASVVQCLGRRNIRTLSTFSLNKFERRKEKMAFWMGDARVKATTPHTFKGWEARLIVVYASQFRSPENRAIIYAALTRIKRSPQGSYLTIVCSIDDPQLIAYGETWPDHVRK
jgi:hypothetical protein